MKINFSESILVGMEICNKLRYNFDVGGVWQIPSVNCFHYKEKRRLLRSSLILKMEVVEIIFEKLYAEKMIILHLVRKE